MADAWWHDAVLYHVYPRSFQDSDGDGVGDLQGIRARLGYLQDLGVNAIWLSPFYRSPMADFGYDISDHCAVDPLFGTLQDFDDLLHACHARALKVLVDLVPNHTSVEHPWFRQSRSSRNAEKRDWYIWREPAPDGGPPNNWVSEFGGSAWAWDGVSRQYYYHAFLPEQPDLNWRNPAVREAVFDIMRFWLERGVDGFRIDVVWHLAKDPLFRDNPFEADASGTGKRQTPLYNTDRPEVFDYIAEMCEVAGAYDDRLLLGEIYLPIERIVSYYIAQGGGVHLPFNFHLIQASWTPEEIAGLIREFEAKRPPTAWPVWALGNHDVPRVATRLGSAQARVAAMLLMTIGGLPTLYYGDELGMRDANVAASESLDPLARRIPGRGRDGPRAPMAWERGQGFGFTTGVPWLRFAQNAAIANAARQMGDPHSILMLYRELIRLRKHRPALRAGAWRLVRGSDGVLAYERQLGAERLLIALNFSDATATLDGELEDAIVLLSTHLDGAQRPRADALRLRPNEGLVLSC